MPIPDPRAAALGAWFGEQHEAPRLSGTSASRAGLAGFLAIGGDLAPSLAGTAGYESVDTKRCLDPLEGLLEGDAQSMPQILSAASRVRAFGPTGASKDFGKNVRIFVPRESEIETLETVTLLRRFRPDIGLLTVPVVTVSFFRAGQDFEGFAHAPVVNFSSPITGIDIGVVLPRQSPEGPLELGLLGRSPNSQEDVVIAFHLQFFLLIHDGDLSAEASAKAEAVNPVPLEALEFFTAYFFSSGSMTSASITSPSPVSPLAEDGRGPPAAACPAASPVDGAAFWYITSANR